VSSSRRVGYLFALWVGVATLLTGPLALINPLFIGWLQDRQDVADKLRITPEELNRVNGAIVRDIFTDGPFDVTWSTGEVVLEGDEVSHMHDVSRLVRILVVVDAVALGFAAWGGRLLRRDPKRLGQMLILGSGGMGALVLGLGLFAAVAWSTAFTLFHQVFFPPGTWSFPPDSTLIQLYPPEFWFEAAMTAAVVVLATAALLSAAGWNRIREADAPPRT